MGVRPGGTVLTVIAADAAWQGVQLAAEARHPHQSAATAATIRFADGFDDLPDWPTPGAVETRSSGNGPDRAATDTQAAGDLSLGK